MHGGILGFAPRSRKAGFFRFFPEESASALTNFARRGYNKAVNEKENVQDAPPIGPAGKPDLSASKVRGAVKSGGVAEIGRASCRERVLVTV